MLEILYEGIGKTVINALCAGTGTCGKCRIKIHHNSLEKINAPTEIEKEFLGNSIGQNIRLACQVFPQDDIVISIIDLSEYKDNLFKIQDSYINFILNFPFNPRIITKFVDLPLPTLKNPVDDLTRLSNITSNFFPQPLSVSNLKPLQQLGKLLRQKNKGLNVIIDVNRHDLMQITEEKKPILGAVVDIGTTSIVATLINLESGSILSVDSIINPQIDFGRDIMTRLTYSLNSPEHQKQLQIKVIKGISELLSNLIQDTNYSIADIYEVVVVGNTVMQHLFLNLPIEGLSRAPFVSIFSQSVSLYSKDIDTENILNLNPYTIFTIPPNIGGFIGSDVVVDILYTNFKRKKGVHLLIDFGTNSEIILVKDNDLFAASVAAGGAFEGQHITYGMRGVKGALEKFQIENGEYLYSVIQTDKPKGICGTGIIDILAQFIMNGQLDRRGRLFDTSGKSVTKLDIVPAEKTDIGETIYVNRHDVEAIQKAKAATLAAIRVLINQLELEFEDIESVLIAGVFGSNLNINNAKIIGLLPNLSNDKFIIQGNTAEKGGRVILLSLEARNYTNKIIENINRLELSTFQEFQDYFIEELFFPKMPVRVNK